MISAVKTVPEKEAWYYSRDGQKFGPTDLGGLRKMAIALHLAPDSLVWHEGLPAWVPATTIETLVFPPRVMPPPSLPAQEVVDPRYGGLYRSSDERMVLGVCAGFAHKWKVPVMAVRVAIALLFPLLMGWAYFLGAFLPALPTKPSEEDRSENSSAPESSEPVNEPTQITSA